MQRAQDRQTILKTELEFMLPGFKSKYKKAILIKTVGYWCKDK